MPDATHALRSGNTFTLKHERVPSRGGLLTGNFRDTPSSEDSDEAAAIMRAAMGAGAVPVVFHSADPGTPEMEEQLRLRDKIRNMLYGGSSN